MIARLRLRALLLALGVQSVAACDQRTGASHASPSADGGTTLVIAAAAADPSRLPEDEEAGLRAQAQWREHLAFEEEERQLMFDRQRLKAHAALVALVRQSRARCDGARNEAALLSAERAMPRLVQELRARVKQLDPWGVNSRLLEDYAWLAATLEGPYVAARRAALEGHAEQLAQLAAEFDARMTKMAEWLRKAAASEEEGEAERERERRRE